MMSEMGDRWAFEPDWLMRDKHGNAGTLDDLSTCPSWLTLDNAHGSHVLMRSNHKALAPVHDSSSNHGGHLLNRHDGDTPHKRHGDTIRREMVGRHLKAQNTHLRNEVAAARKTIGEMSGQITKLHDHIRFLRQITTPGMDVGALDASLATLRGDLLEQARQRERDVKVALCTSEAAREQVQLDLQNERNLRMATEKRLQEEIESLNLQVNRVGVLHSSRENHVALYDARQREQTTQMQRTLERMKEEHKRALQVAEERIGSREAARWREEVLEKDQVIAALQDNLNELSETNKVLGQRAKDQQEQLELAWAELRGLGLDTGSNLRLQQDPKVVEFLEQELEKQRAALVTQFEQEKMKLRREIVRLNGEVASSHKQVADAATSTIENTNSENEKIMTRLRAYHNQLQTASAELKRSSEDNKKLFHRYVAGKIAQAALLRQQEKDSKQLVQISNRALQQIEAENEKLLTVAKIWEQQACDLEEEYFEKERQVVIRDAINAALRKQLHETTESLSKQVNEYRLEVDTKRNAIVELEATHAKLNATIENVQQTLQTLEQEKSVLRADLDIAENEVLCLSTELERLKSEPITKAVPLKEIETQTENVDMDFELEKRKWEEKKQLELKELQKRFAASFKKQVAKMLSTQDQNIEPNLPKPSPKPKLKPTMRLSPPLTKELPKPSPRLETLTSEIEVSSPTLWSVEESLARWEKKQNRFNMKRNRIYGNF